MSAASAVTSGDGELKTPPINSVDGKEKKIGHRRVDNQTGQVTYKKVSMCALNSRAMYERDI